MEKKGSTRERLVQFSSGRLRGTAQTWKVCASDSVHNTVLVLYTDRVLFFARHSSEKRIQPYFWTQWRPFLLLVCAETCDRARGPMCRLAALFAVQLCGHTVVHYLPSTRCWMVRRADRNSHFPALRTAFPFSDRTQHSGTGVAKQPSSRQF